MYPPEVVLKLAQRYPVLWDIRPGKRWFLMRLTVFLVLYVPFVIVLILLNHFTGYSLWSTYLSEVISGFLGVTFFSRELVLRVKNTRPLLAAWVSILSLSELAVLLSLGCLLAYRWKEVSGVLGVLLLFALMCFVLDRYFDRRSLI